MNRPVGASGAANTLLLGLGALIALVGLALAIGGGYLVMLGGSWYYLPAGLALLVAGGLIARRRPAGAWLYALVLVLSALWAVRDAGLEFWPLFSRLYLLTVLALLVALAYPSLVRSAGALTITYQFSWPAGASSGVVFDVIETYTVGSVGGTLRSKMSAPASARVPRSPC